MHIWICSHICNSYILTAPPPLLFWIICRGSKESFRPCGLLWAAVWCLANGFPGWTYPWSLQHWGHIWSAGRWKRTSSSVGLEGIFCPPSEGETSRVVGFFPIQEWCFRKLWITLVWKLMSWNVKMHVDEGFATCWGDAFQRLISHSSIG